MAVEVDMQSPHRRRVDDRGWLCPMDYGDQDLQLWAREFEDVVREIMEDPVFKGNQNFKFEMDLDEAGQRLFGGEANAGVAFQIGQLRCVIYS